ncbi:MAG: molybdopterin oxidoreductase family protein, partial [Pyrinomonadaceae bacterium]
INSVPIRLIEQATQFIHISPGSEDAAVLAVAGNSEGVLARKMGVDPEVLNDLRQTIADTRGDLVVMFGGELSAAAQAVVAQLPHTLNAEGGRVLLHPLPLYNNSIGAHDMGLMNGARNATEMLKAAGQEIRAMYVAGSFLRRQLVEGGDGLGKLDFLVVQELFETATTAFADVVLPAASFAEIDGTFTNNDGLVQRLRQSISPLHQAKADWMITAQLATELGVDFGFQMSASAVFNEIAERVPAYSRLRYPLLKNESNPVQVKHAIAERRDLSAAIGAIRQAVEALPESSEKTEVTPEVGHRLFRVGTMTDKVPQFHLLAAGNPRPKTVEISPLYQITVDENLRQEAVAAGD